MNTLSDVVAEMVDLAAWLCNNGRIESGGRLYKCADKLKAYEAATREPVVLGRHPVAWGSLEVTFAALDSDERIVQVSNCRAEPFTIPLYEAVPDPQCHPEWTVCPRCENDIRRCDKVFAAPPAVPGWRPISEAPKDGAEVWAYNGEQGRMKWIQGDGYALWCWADDVLADVDPNPPQPAHFMPLPEPPVGKDET